MPRMTGARAVPRLNIRVAAALDCGATDAWEAAHSPGVAEQLYRSLLQMQPLGAASFPTRFSSGSRIDVALLLLGKLRLGSQRIVIEDRIDSVAVVERRTMRDSGRPLSGPLSMLRSWNHEITVIPVDDRACTWQDVLTISGWFAPLAACVLFPLWRWRAIKLRRLAREWGVE